MFAEIAGAQGISRRWLFLIPVGILLALVFSLRKSAPPVHSKKSASDEAGASRAKQPLDYRNPAESPSHSGSLKILLSWKTGEPIAGAKVQLKSGTAVVITGSTDKNGEITFHDLAVGEYRVLATPSSSSNVYCSGKAAVIADQESALTLTAPEGAMLNGLVTDAMQRPLAGVQVQLANAFGTWDPEETLIASSYFATTDGNGQFTLGPIQVNARADALLGPGASLKYLLVFRKTGYVVHYLTVDMAERSQWLKVSLDSAPGQTELTGVVVNGANQPIDSVRLICRLHLKTQSGQMWSTREGTTDENGRFNIKFSDEFGPEASILVSGAGYGLVRIPVALHEGTIDLGRITLGSGERISGAVRDQDGKGIGGAAVTLRLQDDEFEEWLEVLSDKEGHFDFDCTRKGDLYYVIAHLPTTEEYLSYQAVQAYRGNVPAGTHDLQFTFKRQ